MGRKIKMDATGDGIVRYDPIATKLRHENEELRREAARRSETESKLRDGIKNLEARIYQMSEKHHSEQSEVTKIYSSYAKQKKKMSDLKKYMQKLPTRDEYEQLKRNKKELEAQNKILTNELRSVKTRIGDYISKVSDLKQSKDDLERELEGARDRVIALESKQIPEVNSDDHREIIEDLKNSNHQVLLKLKAEKKERQAENQMFENEKAKLTETIKSLEHGLSGSKSELTSLQLSNEEMMRKLKELCGKENVNDTKINLAENIDCLDDLVRRILSLQSNIDESDDDEDFNVTHSEFRQTINEDNQNRTMDDLNTQLKTIRSGIDQIGANLAASQMGEACRVQ